MKLPLGGKNLLTTTLIFFKPFGKSQWQLCGNRWKRKTHQLDCIFDSEQNFHLCDFVSHSKSYVNLKYVLYYENIDNDDAVFPNLQRWL
jgi:hypothetical protein